MKLFPDDFVTLQELPLHDAEEIAAQVKVKVECCCEKIEVVGSIRRKRAVVHDVDFVVVAQEAGWRRICEELKRQKARSICTGNAIIKTLCPAGKDFFQVDFYRAQPTTYGIHRLVRTGSAEHNTWLAGLAIAKGMRLQYSQGLMKDGKAIAGEDEAGVFEGLGLPCPEPEKREVVNGEPLWRCSKS